MSNGPEKFDMHEPVMSAAEAELEALSPEARYALEKRELRTRLMGLHQMSEEKREQYGDLSSTLSDIERRLNGFKQDYPEDPDLLILTSVFADLQGDFLNEKDLEIDQGFDVIFREMQLEVEQSSVRRQSLEELEGTSWGPTLERLRALDLPVVYGVSSGKPNAPKLILCMQIHSNPRITDEEAEATGILASQSEIERLVRAELGNVVYSEGLLYGRRNYSDWASKRIVSSKNDAHMGSYRAVADMEDLILVGYEDFARTMDKVQKMSKFARLTSENVLLASNIASLESEEGGEDIDMVVIGGAHESAGPDGTSHPLPLSSVLAYYGIDVLVVDTMTSHYNPSVGRAVSARVTNGGGN